MEIMVDKPGYIEEEVNVVKNVEKRYCVRRYVVEAHTGVLIVRNN